MTRFPLVFKIIQYQIIIKNNAKMCCAINKIQLNMWLEDFFKSSQTPLKALSSYYLVQNFTSTIFPITLATEITFMLFFATFFILAIIKDFRLLGQTRFPVQKNDKTFCDKKQRKQKLEDQLQCQKYSKGGKKKKKKLIQISEEIQKKQEQREQIPLGKRLSLGNENFISIQSKLLFLQPFLIGSMISNLLLVANAASISLMMVTIAFFILFNIVGACSNVKWLSILFLVPAIGSFIPIFLIEYKIIT